MQYNFLDFRLKLAVRKKGYNQMSIVECRRNCNMCKHLSGRTDDKGYPYGYECLKYGDSVFKEKFGYTKIFQTEAEECS